MFINSIQYGFYLSYKSHRICCYLHIHLNAPSVYFFCRFQHRLDLATSGVLCLCRTKKSAGKMFREFQKRSVLKHYIALVSR